MILQKSQEVQHKIVQRQLQMKHKILDLIMKYLKKDIYLQKKREQIVDDIR